MVVSVLIVHHILFLHQHETEKSLSKTIISQGQSVAAVLSHWILVWSIMHQEITMTFRIIIVFLTRHYELINITHYLQVLL